MFSPGKKQKSESNKTIAKNPKITKRRAMYIPDFKVSTMTCQVTNPSSHPKQQPLFLLLHRRLIRGLFGGSPCSKVKMKGRK